MRLSNSPRNDRSSVSTVSARTSMLQSTLNPSDSRAHLVAGTLGPAPSAGSRAAVPARAKSQKKTPAVWRESRSVSAPISGLLAVWLRLISCVSSAKHVQLARTVGLDRRVRTLLYVLGT